MLTQVYTDASQVPLDDAIKQLFYAAKCHAVTAHALNEIARNQGKVPDGKFLTEYIPPGLFTDAVFRNIGDGFAPAAILLSKGFLEITDSQVSPAEWIMPWESIERLIYQKLKNKFEPRESDGSPVARTDAGS